MAESFTVACVQTNAGADPAANIDAALEGIRAAGARGADFIMLPETVGMMEPDKTALRRKAVVEDEDKALAAFCAQAAKTGAWVLVGSLVVRLDQDQAQNQAQNQPENQAQDQAGEEIRLANRSFLIDATGAVTARYDKIHMFDADLGGGEVYRESRAYEAGKRAVLAETPWGVLGMTICYDLRFPHLYRDLAQAGADFITVPSAFTRATGEAHWHVLLRSRAIETGCFVFAPAQCGEHAGGRQTFGHSLVVDPWGEILADGGEDVGVVTAEIDAAAIAAARRRVPALSHDRDYQGP